MEGNTGNRTMPILINLGVSNNYVAPSVVLNCSLNKSNLEVESLVQLATGTKRKVIEIVRHCPLEMNGLKTLADLTVIPLGSYDVLISMDWLTTYWAILDCYNKNYTCLGEEGNIVIVKGIHRPISLIYSTTLQLKKCCRKGSYIYVAHLEESKEKEPQL